MVQLYPRTRTGTCTRYLVPGTAQVGTWYQVRYHVYTGAGTGTGPSIYGYSANNLLIIVHFLLYISISR